MSRPKAYPLQDQREKLALLAGKFEWRTNDHWCSALNVQSVSTIASWKEGRGISDAYKVTIVSFLNKKNVLISLHDFISQDYHEFGRDIGLDENDVNAILSVQQLHSLNAVSSSKYGNVDVRLTGTYVGVYLCHSAVDVLTHAVAIEKFSIILDAGCSRLILKQNGNYVTGRPESGPMTNRNGRIIGQIEYDDSSYPNSVYYLMEILVSDTNKILYGLYTDITENPVREIFSTKFILFSWESARSFPDRSYEGDEFYELVLPFVQNTLNLRARLVVEPPAYELRAEILSAVRGARTALERMAL